MIRIDIQSLRKSRGLSQQALASQLGVKQSFLSAIENGRSPLPARKRKILSEIFGEPELLMYTIDEDVKSVDASRVLGNLSEVRLMQQLKKLFGQDIQNMDRDEDILQIDRAQMRNMEERMRRLWQRNEALSNKNVDLQARIDSLADKMEASTQEIYRLREILLRNNINF